MADRRDGYSRRGDDRSYHDKDRRRDRDDRRHHARDRDRDRDRDRERERDRDRDRDRERDRDRDHRRYRSRSRSRDRDRDRERDRDRADRRRSRSPGRDRDRDRERDRDRDRGYDRDRRDSEKDRDRRRRDGDSEKQRGDRSVRGEVEQRDDAFRRGSAEPAARRSASPKPRGGSVFEREAGEAALPTRTKPPAAAATTSTTTTAAPPSQPGHGSTGLSFKVKPPGGNSSNHSRTNSHGNGPENPQHDHSHNQQDRGRSPSRDNRFDDHDGGDPMDEDEEEIVVEDEGLDDMAAMMGFGGFGSTKGKKVLGNNVGAARKEKQTKYRQYMNRVGGFNRPLSPTR